MGLFKKFLAGSLTVAMVFSLAACGGTDAPATDEGADTAGDEGKVYSIATDTTFAPFEFQNEAGDYVGIDIELLAAIAEDQGFTYELQPLGFNAAVMALESGQADAVIAGMSITEERAETFDFSDPYFDSGVVMGIKADNEEITGYDDLAGKNVAIKIGTEGATFATSIAEEYGFTTVTFDDSSAMYMDVISGNSVACFEDYPVMGYAITQDIGLKIVTDMEHGNSYGFAVGKELNAELLEMFNAGLANLKENGKYQEILDTYIQK